MSNKLKKNNVVDMTDRIELNAEQRFNLMRQAYVRMTQHQQQFSDLAVKRVTEIAKDDGVDLSDAQILGVSFAPNVAIVALVYKPTILAPGEKEGHRQINVPIPMECLCLDADQWKDKYKELLEKMANNVQAAKESGELDKAFNDAVDISEATLVDEEGNEATIVSEEKD